MNKSKLFLSLSLALSLSTLTAFNSPEKATELQAQSPVTENKADMPAVDVGASVKPNSPVKTSSVPLKSDASEELEMIDVKEANKEIDALQAKWEAAKANLTASELHYVQASNKKEKCLIEENQDSQRWTTNLYDYVDKNFSEFLQELIDSKGWTTDVYWDGECKNGYAYGLGREIIKGWKVHIEELTYKDHDNFVKRQGKTPIWWRDFGEKSTIRGVLSFENRSTNGIFTHIEDSAIHGFNVLTMYGTSTQNTDRETYIVSRWLVPSVAKDKEQVSTQNPYLSYLRANRVNDVIIDTVAQTENEVFLGATHVSMPDGTKYNSYRGKRVAVPDDYWDKFNAEIQMSYDAASEAPKSAAKADAMLKSYLDKVCGPDGANNVPEGIDKELYLEICTWDDQFKDRIDAAIATAQKMSSDESQSDGTK